MLSVLLIIILIIMLVAIIGLVLGLLDTVEALNYIIEDLEEIRKNGYKDKWSNEE